MSVSLEEDHVPLPRTMRGRLERFSRVPREVMQRKFPTLVFGDHAVNGLAIESVCAVESPAATSQEDVSPKCHYCDTNAKRGVHSTCARQPVRIPTQVPAQAANFRRNLRLENRQTPVLARRLGHRRIWPTSSASSAYRIGPGTSGDSEKTIAGGWTQRLRSVVGTLTRVWGAPRWCRQALILNLVVQGGRIPVTSGTSG